MKISRFLAFTAAGLLVTSQAMADEPEAPPPPPGPGDSVSSIEEGRVEPPAVALDFDVTSCDDENLAGEPFVYNLLVLQEDEPGVTAYYAYDIGETSEVEIDCFVSAGQKAVLTWDEYVRNESGQATLVQVPELHRTQDILASSSEIAVNAPQLRAVDIRSYRAVATLGYTLTADEL